MKYKKTYYDSKYTICDVCGAYYSLVNKNTHKNNLKHKYYLLKNQ